jgi:hypothetical protein
LACLQPQRADGIAQQVEKETRGRSIDKDCKPLGMTRAALAPAGRLLDELTIDYVT